MNLSRTHIPPAMKLKANLRTLSGFGESFEASGNSQNRLAPISSWSPETSSSGALLGENCLLDHLLLFPFNVNLIFISF